MLYGWMRTSRPCLRRRDNPLNEAVQKSFTPMGLP